MPDFSNFNSWIGCIIVAAIGVFLFQRWRERKAEQQAAPADQVKAPPTLTPIALPDLKPTYIDRDDLMKDIGAINYPNAVILDGKQVHDGFGPAISYVSQPNGNIILDSNSQITAATTAA